MKKAIEKRSELKASANRVVVKVGTAVLTHEDGLLSVPRISSIVEQIAHLKAQGRETLLVSSGSIAFGRKRIRDELHKPNSPNTGRTRPYAGMSRAAAAVGQGSLLSFYECLFQQYDCKVAQVLATKADFNNEHNRQQLRDTIQDLLDMNIIPIINTNDVVEATVPSRMTNGVLDYKLADMDDIFVEDNDSLAALLAVELESDLLIMLTNIDGVYTGPPGKKDSKFLSTFTSHMGANGDIEFGSKSNSGLGGMQSKVRSSLWTLKKGTSVVVCDGGRGDIIRRVIDGEKVGTFFTESPEDIDSAKLADLARSGSQELAKLGAEKRSKMIRDIASALEANKSAIIKENERDLVKAQAEGIEDVLLARLKLTDEKLTSLSLGLNQIAEKSLNQIDRTLKLTKVSDTLTLRQVTCPIGVLLVIFESRPDCLPQISALSLATANGLLLKGGKEAQFSNACLFRVIHDVLQSYGCQDAIQLIDSRERVNEVINSGGQIDLIIPRGSNNLVRSIQELAKSTPVLGHAEGICHVFIDQYADPEAAIKIVVDSKCDYPSACNAMETLLVHRAILKTKLFDSLRCALQTAGVKLNFGSRLSKELVDGRSSPPSYRHEYGCLECTVEVVDSVKEAIDHINEFSSRHTDTIVTEHNESAKEFQKHVDSSSVLVNCSTRFADGFRYGLGAEVGISTSKIHARGPAGMESLLTYKWLLEGSGDTVSEYGIKGTRKYLHQDLDI